MKTVDRIVRRASRGVSVGLGWKGVVGLLGLMVALSLSLLLAFSSGGDVVSIDSGGSGDGVGVEAVSGEFVDPLYGEVSVNPGKYEVRVPFEFTNLSVESGTYEVRLELGQKGVVWMIIKQTRQGMIQVELASKVSFSEGGGDLE